MDSTLVPPLIAALRRQRSVMDMPDDTIPSINDDLPLESVSPEDWIPNPKSLMMGLAGVVGKGSEKLFAKSLIEKLRGPEWKSRSQTVNMPIDSFLQMAEKLKTPDERKLNNVRSLLNDGTPFETYPFLLMSGNKVVGHEGRHRALGLQEQGYTHMPVELRGDIRWSEQADPRKFDYIKEWPSQLIGQQGTSKPFPVPRDRATAAFPEVWE